MPEFDKSIACEHPRPVPQHNSLLDFMALEMLSGIRKYNERVCHNLPSETGGGVVHPPYMKKKLNIKMASQDHEMTIQAAPSVPFALPSMPLQFTIFVTRDMIYFISDAFWCFIRANQGGGWKAEEKEFSGNQYVQKVSRCKASFLLWGNGGHWMV